VSFDAIRWALAQPVDKSPAKFVLVAMASCVNGDGGEMQCWPSVKHLAETTGQDRKTVMDSLRRLRDAGFIADTGVRRGVTGQVPVYLLKSPESGTVTKSAATPAEPPVKPEVDTPNGTESGTGTENGTVPKTDANSTVFPHEQSRFSLETVPETGHGINKEPVRNQEGTRKKGGFDPTAIDLPDWLNRADWSRWCIDRKNRKKPITEDAARLQLRKLDGYRTEGHQAVDVIDNAIANGYAGLFPPSKRNGATPPSTKHAGFSGKNYREGVFDDGSFN